MKNTIFFFFLFFHQVAFTQFSNEKVISDQTEEPASIYATDIDGDGDMDVLSAFPNVNKVVWYTNDGSGNFSEQRIITTEVDGVKSVYATDIDGDGDMDVLSASRFDNKIAWYENLFVSTTSLNDLSPNQIVSMRPNPFGDFLTVKQEVLYTDTPPILLIFNSKGQQIEAIILKDVTQQISTTNLVSGLYFYQIINENGQMFDRGKIVKY